VGGRRWGIVVAVALGSLVAGAGTVAAVSLLTDDDGDSRNAVRLALAESALSSEVNGLLNEIDAAVAAGDETRLAELLDRLDERGLQARQLTRLAGTELAADDPVRAPIQRNGRRLAGVADDVARARRARPETLPVAVRRGKSEVVVVRREIDRVIEDLSPRAAPEDRDRLERERELLTRPTVDLPSDASHVVWATGDEDLLGDDVAGAGDIDGDGVDDLAVAAPGQASVHVLFGGGDSRDLPLDGPDGFTIRNVPMPEDDYELDGLEDYYPDLGAISVDGAGDVDGDGIDDLLIGAANATDDAERQGAAFVVFGSRSPGPVDLADLGGRGIRIDGPGPFWRVGQDVAGLGDIDGDGADDFAIGGRQHTGAVDMTAAQGRAVAWVVYGGQEPAERVRLPREGAPVGWARIDGIGSSLAPAGDFDGDGDDDLIGGDAYNRMDAPGAVAVVFGGDLRDRTVDSTRSGRWGVQVTIPPGRLGGAWVAGAGDRDDDGYADVAVGTEAGSTAPSASRVALIRGGPRGGRLPLAGRRSLTLDGVGPRVAAAGDVNGDDADDLLASVPLSDPGPINHVEGATVLLGDPAGGVPADSSAVLARSFRIDMLDLDANFPEYHHYIYANRLAGIGDFDADGLDDVAIGAPIALTDTDNDVPNRGAAFVVGWVPPAPADLP
jgi:hypothetical protein